MLNGKNWWTSRAVNYDFKEDLDTRIQEAADLIWEEWFGADASRSMGPEHVVKVIKQAMQIINNPGVDPRKFL